MKKLRLVFTPLLFCIIVVCRGQEENKTNQTGNTGIKNKKTMPASKPVKIGTHQVPVILHSIGGEWRDDELFYWEEPIRGTNNKLLIRELQPHILVSLEWYDRQTKSYPKGDRKGTQLVPTKLEFYSDKGELSKVYDINKESPYTRAKYPNIIQEHYYDGEGGFGDAEYRKTKPKAKKYWTNVQPLAFNQNGYVGVVYHLYGLDEDEVILFDHNTVRMFDYTGTMVFELKDIDETIVSTLITPDGKYAVVNVGGERDINDMSDALSPEGFIIYEVKAGKEIYREYGENSDVYVSIARMWDDYISLSLKNESKSDTNYQEDYYFFNYHSSQIFKKKISKKEYDLIQNNFRNNSEYGVKNILKDFNFYDLKI
ncbi:MAG TPA: hypothetical protein PKD40_02865 [Saprospiraceae bacterium]|nr:hypothetical protein [Saprospiraceae bacterium]